jgi:NitT/TauT family transport system substrate-binding protein
MMFRRVRYPLVALLVGVVAGCGGLAPPAASTGSPQFTTPVSPVTGCGAQSHVDPADRSPQRAVARCEAGTPAPAPLPQRELVRLAAQSKGEYLAPVLLGIANGEFEKENLQVEISAVSFADALPQLVSGGLDVSQGGPYASLVNGAGSGLGVRWVLGNYAPSHGGEVDVPQAGLWFRRDAFTDPAHPGLANLVDRRPVVANTQGSGTPAAYWMERAFRAAGIDYADVEFQQLGSADQVTALRSGAVQGAFLVDPYWQQIADDPAFVQVAVQDREVNGGMFYGTRLLQERPDIGEAFARAYIRTINSYLAGNYKSDTATIAALAQQAGVPAEVMARGTPLLFDWQIPQGLTDDLQRTYIALGAVRTISEPLPEDQLATRAFYDRAVGHAEG